MTDRRLSRIAHGDEGLTLIEVIVAMFVFAIIASGLIAGMVTITKTTGDNRAQVVAANLASQELDLVRAIADPFQVQSNPPVDMPVGGRTYTLKRTVSWVSQAGTDVSCNSSTNLFFLRVNVRVSWVGQIGTRAVQDDTILAPTSRISDTSSGAIAVSVVGADGSAESGVSVSIQPTSGGKALTTQPANTGSDGCTYANQVAPGTYSVTLSRSSSVDTAEVANPVKSVTVTAGTTQSASFQYDQAATYTTTYAKNYTARAALVPVNVETSFYNTNVSPSGVYTTGAPAASVALHPFASGYSAVVGPPASGTTTCASIDPQAWSAGTSNGVPLAGGTRPVAAAAAGASTTLAIPMGVVLLNAPAGYLIGISQATPTGSGNPGCGISGSLYYYGSTSTGSQMAIAVPYGSWNVFYGTSATNKTQIAAANLSVPTNAAGGGVSANGTVTVDPRPLR